MAKNNHLALGYIVFFYFFNFLFLSNLPPGCGRSRGLERVQPLAPAARGGLLLRAPQPELNFNNYALLLFVSFVNTGQGIYSPTLL